MLYHTLLSYYLRAGEGGEGERRKGDILLTRDSSCCAVADAPMAFVVTTPGQVR